MNAADFSGARPEPGGDGTGSAEADYQQAVALARRGDLAAARPLYERVADSGHPRVAVSAMLDLGTLFKMLGETSAARSAYQRAVDSGDPGVGPLAARDLGLLLRELGDDPGATAAYRQAIASDHPEAAPTAANNLGNLLADLGDGDGAITAYQYAVASGHPARCPLPHGSWATCCKSAATSTGLVRRSSARSTPAIPTRPRGDASLW